MVGSDDHESTYDILEISNQQYGNILANKLQRNDVHLWDRENIINQEYARVTLSDYLCYDEVAKTILASLVKYGMAFIEKVPANLQSTEMTVKRLFAVQKTLFGEMWSFSDNKDHADSAYSKSYLAAHTDNTYFNDAAGLQIFHCTQHSGTGGESLLLDGFKVLDHFKEKHPDSYKRLCNTAVPAEYIEENQYHSYCAPIIRLDPISKLPEQIRFFFLSNRKIKTNISNFFSL